MNNFYKPDNTCKECLDFKLDRLLELPIGWDGYGGVAPSIKTIAKAKSIASALPEYAWQCVPGGDGSVQLEHHLDGYDIEIYIFSV